MKRAKLLLLITYLYSACAYSNYQFLCEIVTKNNQKISLPGTLYNTKQLTGLTVAELESNANSALPYTLCQQAGFGYKGNLSSVSGIRSSANVSKYQQYPDPACVLKCKLLGSH